MKHTTRLLTFVLALTAPHILQAQQEKASVYSPREQLRNYAFSTCFSYAFPNSDPGKDAASAAAGYLELGSGPLEAYTEAAKLSKAFVQRTYIGQGASHLQTMKCIDLYHSPALDRIVGKYFAPAIKQKK